MYDMAKLTINPATLERLRDGQTWGALADQIGIDAGVLSRVRRGEQQPGPKFIANVLTKFPVRMDELVTVEHEEAA